METRQTTLKASDIKCEGCAGAARSAVGSIPGVQGVMVSVPEQTVTVVHEPHVSRTQLAEILTKAGFPAR